MFLWRRIDRDCTFLYIRHKKFTWKLRIVQGNLFHFQYSPKSKNLSCHEGILDRIMGYPEQRIAIETIFNDLELKSLKKGHRISLASYKWLRKATKQFLLEVDVNIEERDKNGKSLLHFAARIYDQTFLECILGKFDDVNLRDLTNVTPFHEACNYGNYHGAKRLLEHGANVNDVTLNGDTGLMLLANRKEHDSKFFKLLLQYNADCEIENQNSMRAVDIARQTNKHSTVISLIHPFLSQMC